MRALPTWASQETRALEDIAARSPYPPFIYINRDNRASVTGQWPGLRPRISFVGSRRRDARDTPSIAMRAPRKIATSPRFAMGYGIAAYGGKGISAAPSVNCRRSCHASVTSRHTYEPSTPLPFLARASFVRETRPSHDGVTRNIRSRTNVPFFFFLSLSLAFLFVINKRKIASRRFNWTNLGK